MAKIEVFEKRPAKLGINSLGRIGKLSLWHHIGRKYFQEIVVNQGREVGTGLQAVAQLIEKDATYGLLHKFLYGIRAERVIELVDEKKGKLLIDGIPVTILREARNPNAIPWRDYGVDVVAECTGKFGDPDRSRGGREGVHSGSPGRGSKGCHQFVRLQNKEQGFGHARRCGYGHLWHKPSGLRRKETPSRVRGVVHHHGPRPHGQAPPGKRGDEYHTDRFHVHGARGDQLRRQCSIPFPRQGRRI